MIHGVRDQAIVEATFSLGPFDVGEQLERLLYFAVAADDDEDDNNNTFVVIPGKKSIWYQC